LISDVDNPGAFRLGNINFVIDTCKHIVVVHTDVRIETDGNITGLILIEKVSRLLLHDFFQLRTGYLHREQRVIIFIYFYAVPM